MLTLSQKSTTHPFLISTQRTNNTISGGPSPKRLAVALFCFACAERKTHIGRIVFLTDRSRTERALVYFTRTQQALRRALQYAYPTVLLCSHRNCASQNACLKDFFYTVKATPVTKLCKSSLHRPDCLRKSGPPRFRRTTSTFLFCAYYARLRTHSFPRTTPTASAASSERA